MTSSTSASSTPRMIVAFDCLRNPPELCSRVARNSLSSRASTRAPASSLWTMATTSFTRGVSTPHGTVVNVCVQPGRGSGGVRCDPDLIHAAGVPRAHRRTDHRSTRFAGRRARGGRRCRQPRRDARGRAGRRRDRAPSRRWARSSCPTRTGPGCSSPPRAAWTTQGIASLSEAVTDAADPFAVAAATRVATFDREASMPDGSSFVGAYLPLIVSSAGVDVDPRVDRLWLGGAARPG